MLDGVAQRPLFNLSGRVMVCLLASAATQQGVPFCLWLLMAIRWQERVQLCQQLYRSKEANALNCRLELSKQHPHLAVFDHDSSDLPQEAVLLLAVELFESLQYPQCFITFHLCISSLP